MRKLEETLNKTIFLLFGDLRVGRVGMRPGQDLAIFNYSFRGHLSTINLLIVLKVLADLDDNFLPVTATADEVLEWSGCSLC